MCPPGVDQTCRTEEDWHLLTPMREEQHDLTQDFSLLDVRDTGPQHFILGDLSWDAFDKLVRKTPSRRQRQPSIARALSQRPVAGHSAIESLPIESLNMIVTDQDLEKKHLIALGLSSQSLWLVVLDHIKQKERKRSWANTPLVLTGSYLTDVPAAVHQIDPDMARRHTEWLQPKERPLTTSGSYHPRGRYYQRGMCPARKWNWAAVSDYEDVGSWKQTWLDCFDSVCKDSGISSRDVADIRQSLNEAFRPPKSPVNQPTNYILRNHTASEYVILKRSNQRRSETNYLHVKGCPWLSLDKALVLRICWTWISSHGNMPDALRAILKGAWAGHCFDVVASEEVLEGLAVEDQWEDVTKEIVAEARAYKAAAKTFAP